MRSFNDGTKYQAAAHQEEGSKYHLSVLRSLLPQFFQRCGRLKYQCSSKRSIIQRHRQFLYAMRLIFLCITLHVLLVLISDGLTVVVAVTQILTHQLASV